MCELFYRASNEQNEYLTQQWGFQVKTKVRAVTVTIDFTRINDEDIGERYLERKVR